MHLTRLQADHLRATCFSSNAPRCTPTKGTVAMSWQTKKYRDPSMPRWTPMDVYERPWMAPRAGCEIDHKYMVLKGGRLASHGSTPTDTPPM